MTEAAIKGSQTSFLKLRPYMAVFRYFSDHLKTSTKEDFCDTDPKSI